VTQRWATPAAAALSHARRGWVLVPLRPGTGLPVRKWANLTSTPPGTVAARWPGPQHNPGIATGPSGLVVVDLDSLDHHGGQLPTAWAGTGVTHGTEVLAVLAARARENVPPTYTVLTRSGIHLYFTAPAGPVVRNSAGKIGPVVDVRGRGGLVVGAGSVRDGRLYELADDRDPVPLPGWLAELAARQDPAPSHRAASALTSAREARGYGAAALRAEVATVLAAGPGRRNDTLNRSAYSLGQLAGTGDLAETEITAALMNAAESIGLVADDGLAQCQRTIASGLAAGIAQPRARRSA